MLQETVARLEPLCGAGNVLVITGSAHRDEVLRQLPALDVEQVVAEPLPRGSGPAIGLGIAIIHQRDPRAIVGSFAADHIVTEPDRFQAAVRTAIETARRGYLVTIGIQPSYAETGYGYICAGREIAGHDGLRVHEVEQFKEKPDLETAAAYVASGRYLWNASMFVWQAATLMDEMRRHLPDLAQALGRIAAAWDTSDRARVMAETWPAIADVTIDQGILEKSDRVAVVPADFGWTDLGDWHGFGNVTAADAGANVAVNTEVLARDARGTVVMGNGRLVALLGVEDIVVVDTDDALLICDRNRAQDVKLLVDELRKRGSTHLI
jgi:mannose-1-phosphate guanylyltransferase